MDAKSCWGLSAAIHGTLLVGAALIAFAEFAIGDGGGTAHGPRFRCGLRDAGPKFARIDRPKDTFGTHPPKEESPIAEIYSPAGGPGVYPQMDDWPDCCECTCGGAATTVVAWPRDIVSYFDRKLSMATSRRGVPRLYAHSRHCPFRETRIDADCTCGLIPPRY